MYPSIDPPAGVPPGSAMTRAQAREYFAWFIAVIPERVSVLKNEIRREAVTADWQADFSEPSLLLAGRWLAAHSASQKKDPVDVRDRHGHVLTTVDWDLTGDTFARCFDVGVYFGETLVRNFPRLHWRAQDKGSTRNINYGHAVVAGAGPMACNPVHLVVTHAYGLVRGNRTAGDLAKIYTTWRGILAVTPAK